MFILFAHEILTVGRGGSSQHTWSWTGSLLPYPDWLDEDACSGDHEVINGDFFSEGQAYPESLGSFDLEVYKNCEYKGEEDSVGEATCDDRVALSCVGVDAAGGDDDEPSADCWTVSGPTGGLAKDQLWTQAYCVIPA